MKIPTVKSTFTLSTYGIIYKSIAEVYRRGMEIVPLLYISAIEQYKVCKYRLVTCGTVACGTVIIAVWYYDYVVL